MLGKPKLNLIIKVLIIKIFMISLAERPPLVITASDPPAAFANLAQLSLEVPVRNDGSAFPDSGTHLGSSRSQTLGAS